MYFIVTIDTEEDNWGNFHEIHPTVNNIKNLKIVQKIFENYKIRPTYLVTYPVVCDRESIEILKSFHYENNCEIGTHLHPWNTPPIEEEICDKNSMLNNLSKNLQYKKLNTIHNKIKEELGTIPTSFRAGRYGINDDMVKNLVSFGYKVESSITPFIDWSRMHGPNFKVIGRLSPYICSSDDLFKDAANGELIEVPLTVGFLYKNYNIQNFIYHRLNSTRLSKLKIGAMLSSLGMIKMIRLSPEGYNSTDIISLIKVIQRKGIKFFNFSFHSTSLLTGCSPFVSTKREFDKFLSKIEKVLQYVNDMKFESITLSDVTSNII